ncbi:MAG: DEAD/DEAH box helicase, partial [Deltaproteobacteria bacterium]
TALNEMRGQVLLADEVGLGKTIQAGLILKELKLRGLIRRILILTPATVLKQWQEEMETKFHETFRIAEGVEDWHHPQVLASLSLAKMPHHAARILQKSYDLLIVDEAHTLKHKSTQRFKFVNQIKKKYILLLTATPVHNTLTELYSLVTILKPGLLGTLRSFNKQFVDREDPRKPKNPEHLKKILSQVMIRNRRGQVGIQLPPRKAGIFYVRLTRAERELYDGVTAYIREEFKRETNHLFRLLSLTTLQRELCSSPHALRGTLEMLAARSEYPEATRKRLRHFLTLCDKIKVSSKTQAVLKILKEYPGKFIIFTNFLATMHHLQEVLERRGISTVTFHGNLNMRRRREVIQQFSGGKRILISTQAGGDGLNLQFCNQLINYDLPWNPMLVEQRIGRIHRLGQKKTVYVVNLTLSNTIESRIMYLLARKIQMFKLVIGELDLILGMVNQKKSFEQTVSELWHKARNPREADQAFRKFGSELTRARKDYEKVRKSNEVFGDLVRLTDFFDREETRAASMAKTPGRAASSNAQG